MRIWGTVSQLPGEEQIDIQVFGSHSEIVISILTEAVDGYFIYIMWLRILCKFISFCVIKFTVERMNEWITSVICGCGKFLIYLLSDWLGDLFVDFLLC